MGTSLQQARSTPDLPVYLNLIPPFFLPWVWFHTERVWNANRPCLYLHYRESSEPLFWFSFFFRIIRRTDISKEISGFNCVTDTTIGRRGLCRMDRLISFALTKVFILAFLGFKRRYCRLGYACQYVPWLPNYSSSELALLHKTQ